jgi:hypothetical protein
MSNRNDDTVFWLACIALAVVGFVVYSFVKSVGSAIGLPPGPTAWLLVGFIGFSGGMLYAWLSGRQVNLWVWWLAAGTFWFITPALDYWALDTVSKMMVDSAWDHRELTRAWYGQSWVHVLTFVSLCGIATFMYQRDRY